MSTVQHLTDSDDFSARFNAIITALRADRQYRYMHLHFIREGKSSLSLRLKGPFLYTGDVLFHMEWY